MDRKYMDFREDSAGFFHIYLDGPRRNIVVEHYVNVVKDIGTRRRTVSGKLNKVFKGTNAETIYRTILGNNLIGRIDHAAYIGYELGKAETALKNSLRYEQDRPLKV
jgi:tetrahydromethanopterin S-methyltransferase subunit A